jgi:hypothetical protein
MLLSYVIIFIVLLNAPAGWSSAAWVGRFATECFWNNYGWKGSWCPKLPTLFCQAVAFVLQLLRFLICYEVICHILDQYH